MKPRDLIGTGGGWLVFRGTQWTALPVTAGNESVVWFGEKRTNLLSGGGVLRNVPTDVDDPCLFACADETAAKLKANALNIKLQHATIEAATKRLEELKAEGERLRNGGVE